MRSTCKTMLALALGLTLCLPGCGGSKPSDTSDGGESASTEQVQDTGAEEEAPAETEDASQELGKAELEVSGCDYRYELKEVGSFEGTKNGLSFQYDGAIGFNDASDPQLLGVDGKPLIDGAAIAGIDYWANGLYLTALKSEEVNNTGLVSITDGVVVPLEAATLSYATEEAKDARFIEVVYATEKTENEDECFVYSTDKMFSMSVEEGDIMYKGYAKVFDLEKRSFVDGVEITNGARYALKDLGDAFVVQDEDDKYTMYDASGKEVWSSDDYVSFGRHSLTYEADGKYCIVNTKGETTFATSDGYINTLISTDDLYLLQIDDDKKVIDSEGNVVLEESYEKVVAEYDGLFEVSDGGKSMIVDAQGKVLTDDVEEFTVNRCLPGILTYKNGAGKRNLCLSNGTIIEDVDGSMSDLDFYKDDSHLVISTGKYDVALSSPSVLDIALLRGQADGSSDQYELHELFTGSKPIDGSYETINWAGGYVFAFKDGTWTSYEAKLVL